jgi:beta-carotene hydroxylase
MGEVTSDMSVDLNIADMSEEQLDVAERRIAGKYMQIVPWEIVLWGIGNTLIWLSLWPLVFMDIMPLWMAFPIALVCVHLSYLPSHDCQHSIIAREGRPLRWLNELVGHIALIPMAAPLRYLRHTHMEHHRHTNDPELDPDFDVHAKNRRQFFMQMLLKKQPGNGGRDRYAETLLRIGRPELMIEAAAIRSVHTLVLIVGAWSGHAIEVALLWWLPLQIMPFYISYYLSWKPHHPGSETSRYRDTSAFKSQLGNLGSSGMQYHIVHHLYPTIPLTKTPAAFRELKPILERRGCEFGGLTH